MFEAQTMAVIGASGRSGSFGARLAHATLSRRFQGKVSFVNPRGGQILGHDALPAIDDLDYAPDLVVLGVGGNKLEAALVSAIDKGARSAVIFDSCQDLDANGNSLLDRLRDIAREANMPVCGGSGMGFINMQRDIVASFYPADHLKPGGISLIAHSGSVFTVLGMNDPRFRFDLMVSPGQEIGASIDEYITYAASRESTRAIAVFMESARMPDAFVDSLKFAFARRVPVVICKTGRSEESARLARSHTGALAGNQTAYEAVFESCAAISVDSVDEMMNTALLCASGRIPGPGGAGLVTDSGGLRQLQVDLAREMSAPLARLSVQTVTALRAALPPELEPSNPLDCAADLTEDYAGVFDAGLQILAEAPEVSMLGFEADLRDDYIYEDKLFNYAKSLTSRTDKPVFVYTSFGQSHNRAIADQLGDLGVPCLNGVHNVLTAVAKFQTWADGLQAEPEDLPQVAATNALPEVLDESASLHLLADYGVPVAKSVVCDDAATVDSAAREVTFPVALKTAQPGADHKTELHGVILNIATPENLKAAYADLSTRLGPRVTVQQQADQGVELAFGCIVDEDFGPLVAVSAGGTLVELFSERQFARAPISPRTAQRMIRKLTVSRLIDGVRGAPPCDMDAAAAALSAFSQACAGLQKLVREIDVNPVIVSQTGALAVDALIIPLEDTP
jgi:acyl-CoA synthetase (NDP forming)